MNAAISTEAPTVQQLLSAAMDVMEIRKRRPQAKKLILRSLEVAGASGLITEAIAKNTHLPIASVSARVGEMLRAGEVLPVALRRTSTGRPAWAFVSADVLNDAADGNPFDERWNQARANRVGVLEHKGRWNGKATL